VILLFGDRTILHYILLLIWRYTVITGLGLAQKLLKCFPLVERFSLASKKHVAEKETRCCGILFEKCPVFMGLLRTDYAKLFLYDPLLFC